ncbi:hypothetical protein [Streptomyces sp. NBC_01435]|uniref:hypothetical protein n=1 Tax=Streptomyces sp. NBC_01435 TaxID=2903865 RepID=UPI003FCE4529
MEKEKRPEDGVCREALEETGIRVRVEHLSGVHKNMTRGIIALVFLCRPVGGEESGPATHSTTRPRPYTRTTVIDCCEGKPHGHGGKDPGRRPAPLGPPPDAPRAPPLLGRDRARES